MIVKSTFRPLNRREFSRGCVALCMLAGLYRITPAYALEPTGASNSDPPSRTENPRDPAQIGKQHAITGGRNRQPSRAHIEARKKRLKEAGKLGDRKQAKRNRGVSASEAPR